MSHKHKRNQLTRDDGVALQIILVRVSGLQKHVGLVTSTGQSTPRSPSQTDTTYNNKTASHSPARSNTRCRFVSTLDPSSPISATPTLNSGFPTNDATLSAVNVLPTPGTPASVSQHIPTTHSGTKLTPQQNHQPLPLPRRIIRDIRHPMRLHALPNNILIRLIQLQLPVKRGAIRGVGHHQRFDFQLHPFLLLQGIPQNPRRAEQVLVVGHGAVGGEAVPAVAVDVLAVLLAVGAAALEGLVVFLHLAEDGRGRGLVFEKGFEVDYYHALQLGGVSSGTWLGVGSNIPWS